MKKERNKRAVWVSKGCKRLNMHFSKEYRNRSYFIKSSKRKNGIPCRNVRIKHGHGS